MNSFKSWRNSCLICMNSFTEKKLSFSKRAHLIFYPKSNMALANLILISCTGIFLAHQLLIFQLTRREVCITHKAKQRCLHTLGKSKVMDFFQFDPWSMVETKTSMYENQEHFFKLFFFDLFCPKKYEQVYRTGPKNLLKPSHFRIML